MDRCEVGRRPVLGMSPLPRRLREICWMRECWLAQALSCCWGETVWPMPGAVEAVISARARTGIA